MRATAGAPYHRGVTARERWNRRYAGGNESDEPSGFVTGLEELLSPRGRALDVAGGAGRHALWLAEQGWEVTLVDISDHALALVREAAERAGVAVQCRRVDLEKEPLPKGPWDLILCMHYLQRDLFSRFVEHLAPGGILVFAIATERNRERHQRPPPQYLLSEGEAPHLVPDLEIISYEEGWSDEGRHEARVVARKP